MLPFEIPDTRLLWSLDQRFLEQFKEGKISRFVPLSKFPPCYKDVAFCSSPGMRWGIPLSTSGPMPNSKDSHSEQMAITVEETVFTLRTGLSSVYVVQAIRNPREDR
ncbi:hypothetical protein B9Z19DRAFT_1066950 [Tuber borchii]|uniref:Uncharacterized protein n=1 Tax=Tuber borchii TaxID=42251 RepID=A0A2T6ZKQ7_TUBBO|nr:hypothetical protein B9Z19DRAFT_1066950 [Tuber borchii]